MLLLVSKLKFLLLGLTKASTFISMFAFFGVYWSIYGWPLALGLVLSIYIHEMGHVAMLRRLVRSSVFSRSRYCRNIVNTAATPRE